MNESNYLKQHIEAESPAFLEWIWKAGAFDSCWRACDDLNTIFERGFELACDSKCGDKPIFFYDCNRNGSDARLFWIGNETEIIEFLWDAARKDKVVLIEEACS